MTLFARLREVFDNDIESLGRGEFRIVSKDVLVLIDVPDEHALDRDVTLHDFTLAQLSSVTNDIQKNSLARQKGLSLIRVRSDVDIDAIQTFDDLLKAAYHVVAKGNVLKEGTFRIDEDLPLMSREQLVRTNETEIFPGASGRDLTEKELLPLFHDIYRAHVAYHGWFYPKSDETLEHALQAVRASTENAGSSSEFLSNSSAGSTWLKAFVRAYWDVDNGHVKSFQSDGKLDSVLRYRLGLNNSKLYTYTLSDGQVVSCKETFDMNLKNVRFGFAVQRNSTSWFKPSWAAQIYARFLSGIEKPVVWDPSVGFSARLLGFSSVCQRGKYIGTDPAGMMVSDAERLVAELGALRPELEFDIRQEGSEVTKIEPESLDLVMTSPPYFDKEKYVDEPGQCWRDHPSLEAWTKSYLVPTLEAARKGVKPSGHVIINVDSKRAPVVQAASQCVGLVQVGELRAKTGRDHFNRKTGHVDSDKSEPVLVFRRA